MVGFSGVLTLMTVFMRCCADGNHRSAVPPDRALSADPAWQRGLVQSASLECDLVRRRARLQMARSAQAVRQLAHDLHPHEPLVQKRGAGSPVRTVAARSDRPHQDRGCGFGQHRRESASRWHRGSKKNGTQAIGKSRGGWTTKIHMVAANARTAITFALSPGQAHDAPEERKLLRRVGTTPRPLHLIMDRAYEGDETRRRTINPHRVGYCCRMKNSAPISAAFTKIATLSYAVAARY